MLINISLKILLFIFPFYVKASEFIERFNKSDSNIIRCNKQDILGNYEYYDNNK